MRTLGLSDHDNIGQCSGQIHDVGPFFLASILPLAHDIRMRRQIPGLRPQIEWNE